jgi:predicted MFS family arabinose efflux permease
MTPRRGAGNEAMSFVERAGPRNPWIYVASGFCTQFFGVTTMYVVFNFLSPVFQTKYGWSQFATSFSMTLFWLANGVSIVSLGILIDNGYPLHCP